MPLRFTETFWNENGRNLRKPDLICLRQDPAFYNILLFQPHGDIDYENTGIWFTDNEVANTKFNLFFNKAIEHNVDLALTPEYSCPFSIIHGLLAENKTPSEGRIWAIGCQSISPPALTTFIQNHPEVVWIYDQALLAASQNVPDRFFDPACLIFKTKNTENQLVTVVIVQFKTMFFGGDGMEWEQENLIQGEINYVVSNQYASTKLVVLLCSDTLEDPNFNSIQEGYFQNSPLLLIHLQLNQKPFQNNYKNYRNLIFSKGEKDANKEVICLNWARNVTCPKLDRPWNKYGGSAFYIKSETINTEDLHLNNNHKKGLYYTNWYVKRSHICFLNYDEHVFLIRNTKPSQINGDPTQARRAGPIVTAVFDWHNNSWRDLQSVSDGFCDLCTTIEGEYGDLSCIKNLANYIEAERLIELSLGKFVNNKKWYETRNLTGLLVDDNEFNDRLNFDHDPDRPAKERRSQKIVDYAHIKHSILPKQDKLPVFLRDAVLGYDEHLERPYKFLLNLHSTTSRHKGTGVFIGVSTPQKAKIVRSRVEGLFEEDQQRQLVVVWYYHTNGLEMETDEASKPKISQNVEHPPTSYKAGKKNETH
ncbi:MAG: hypothetical protein HOP10_02240 [Chitinophagaceae bacterium]|nr:hypothetical protein [Chitinophagaceae bacterium]